MWDIISVSGFQTLNLDTFGRMDHPSITDINSHMSYPVFFPIFTFLSEKKKISWFELAQIIFDGYFYAAVNLLGSISWDFQTIQVIDHLGKSTAIHAFTRCATP